MARERRTAGRRDSAVERERRERARRERERRRAESAAAREARRAAGSTATKERRAPAATRAQRPQRELADVAVRERHEGLVGFVVRTIVSLPSTIASLPTLVVAGLRSFALEVVTVVGGIGRVLLSVLPGSRRVAGAGRSVVDRARSTRAGAVTATEPIGVGFGEAGTGRRQRAPRTVAQQRAAEQRRARLRRRLRLAFAGAVLVGVVAAWVVVPASDVFRIRHLEVTGAGAVGDLEVRERVDSLLVDKTVFTVDEEALAARIEELPFVRDVRVERHLPGGLQLHVLEYRPLALGFGEGRFWLVARDGRVLAKASRDEWSGRIPTVELRGDDIQPGDHVDDEPSLQLLSSRSADSMLEFETIKADEYAIVARLEGGIEVRFGRPIALRQKLLVAEAMLQQAARKDLEPLYVDVTVPGKPAFCAKSVTACGMRRGPAPTDTRPGRTTGEAATATGDSADAADGGAITNGADELAADGA